MGKLLDKLFPRVPAPTREIRLSSAPTSPLTRPINVTSAIEFERRYHVTREALMSIAAFRKAVILITGVVGSLSYQALNADGERIDHKLLAQPERLQGLTKTASMTQLATDIYLDGSALWYVQETDRTTGFPTAVKRVPFNEWTQDPETGEITLEGEKQPPEKVRLFVGSFPGLLSAAGPTVHLIQRFAALSEMYAANPQAREVLRGSQGLNLEDDQIEELLTDWEDKRRHRVTPFLPEELAIEQLQPMTPEQMTLNGANAFLVEQAARIAGIDGFWLGVGQQSGMTYSNRIDLREDLKTFLLHPVLVAPIEERLSLGDCTPITQRVVANWDSYLRLNTLDRYNAHAIGLTNGFITLDEVRALENRPPLPNGATP